MQRFDILYYSNFCIHSRKVIDYVSKNELINKLNCICVDNRIVDSKSGQLHIQKENGKYVLLPPNVHSVPALLVAKQNYVAIFGKDAIFDYLDPIVSKTISNAVAKNGEPVGTSLGMGSVGVSSEKFTFFNGRSNDMMDANSVSNYHNGNSIHTPPDNYKTDRIHPDAGLQMMDILQKQRDQDVAYQKPENPYGF